MHNVVNISFRRVSANFNVWLQSKLAYLLKCNIQSKVLDDLLVHWHQNFIALKLISFIFIKTFKYFPHVLSNQFSKYALILRHGMILLPINFKSRVIHYHQIEHRGKINTLTNFNLKMTGIFQIDISNFARASIFVLCLYRVSPK